MNYLLYSILCFVTLEFLSNILKDKFNSLSLKKERILLGTFFAISIISQSCVLLFFKLNENLITSGISIILNSLSILLLYRIIKSKFGRENAILLGISLCLILPFLCKYMINTYIALVIFCIGFLGNLIKDLDYGSVFRKKNILKYFFMTICLVVIFFKNTLLLPIAFGIIYCLYKKMNNKKKNILIIYFALLIFLIFVFNMFIFKFDVFINKWNNNVEFAITLGLTIFYTYQLFYKVMRKEVYKKDLIITLINIYLAIISFISNSYKIIYIWSIVFSCYIGFENKYYCIKKYIPTKKIKKVSVVIPNYNYAHYIVERIDSILNQTYPIYELIILDDMSKDNSIEVIEKKLVEIKEKYPNLILKFIKNEVNSGNVFKQWTKAFEVSSGDYLWIAEADDLSNKHFLNLIMKGFKNDDVILSYSESLAIDEFGHVFKKDLRDWIDIFRTGKWNKDYIVSGKQELKDAMCINNTIANVSSVVFNKNKNCDFAKYLKVSQEFTLAGDWYFYTKVLLNGSVAYFRESLNYHRIHSNSVTTTTDNFVHYNEIVKIQDSVKNDVNLSTDEINKIERRRNLLKRDFGISEEELYYKDLKIGDLIKEKNITDDVLLSIIMPVYNTEKYLNKCFKSFMKYLPEKTEVIVINDGSPDNSENIILDYANKFKSIRYIKKENGGLSSVKNVGLREAKGKYITFIDSDDYVSSNMYSTMLKKAIEKNADLIYCDVLMVYENGKIEYRNMTNYERKDNDIMQHIDTGLMAASWNKLVKKELYAGIEFPEKMNNEDVAVSPILFERSKNTMKVESPFYKYVQRSGSIQNSGFNEKRFVIFDTVKILFDNIKEYPKEEIKKIQGAVLTHQLIAILMYLIVPIENDNERKKYIKMFCEQFNKLSIIKENEYLIEFLEKNNIENLLEYVYANEYDKLDEYMHCKYEKYTKV